MHLVIGRCDMSTSDLREHENHFVKKRDLKGQNIHVSQLFTYDLYMHVYVSVYIRQSLKYELPLLKILNTGNYTVKVSD